MNAWCHGAPGILLARMKLAEAGVQTKKDIVHKIKAVQNTEYQTLLELRYLCFKSWEQIAVDMGYELRWLYRLHHRALDAVSEISH